MEEAEEVKVLKYAKRRLDEIESSLRRIPERRKRLDEEEEGLKQTMAKWISIVDEVSREVQVADGDTEVDFINSRLADACYYIMRATGHGLHAKELVRELQRRGRVINAKVPVDSVHKMLLRDRRFYQPGNHGTYWELEEWHPLSVEENKATQQK